jgi:alpha-N-acetylglucosamine transferase
MAEKIKAILSLSIEELRKERYIILPRDECDAYRLADPKTEKGKLWKMLVDHLLDAWHGSHLELDDLFIKLCRISTDC